MRSLHPWPFFPANLDPPAARSLSLQFILQELVSAFDLVRRLQNETPEHLSGYFQDFDLAAELSSISQKIEKFLLFSLENPFAQKGGVLDKLCFYCEILLQASNIADQELTMILEEMRNAILRIKSRLTSWKKMPEKYPVEQVLAHLMALYSDLHQNFCQFFLALCPFLEEARSDENVLIYLIEQRFRLNQHLGLRTVEEFLQRLFPNGHEQLRSTICDGYSRRGFASFFAKAQPLIDALEWEAPCHPPLQRL